MDPTQGLDKYHRPTPVPSNTQVYLGDSPLAERLVVDIDDMTPYHYVEIGGLTLGKTYSSIAASQMASPQYPHVGNADSPTAAPPLPGDRRLHHPSSASWRVPVRDGPQERPLHLGEMTSGLAFSDPALPGGGFPPGFAADPQNPYWRVMARAAVAESRQRGAQLMIMAGDLTSEAQPLYMQEAKDTFDNFGVYRQDYFVARGNHDRAQRGPGQRRAAVHDLRAGGGQRRLRRPPPGLLLP